MVVRVDRQILERGLRRRKWRERVGLLGGLAAGLVLAVYAFWGGRTIFMEQGLSVNHAGLEKRCGNCHHPFEGVKDSRCTFPCHAGEEPEGKVSIPYLGGIHYSGGGFKNGRCFDCHPPQCHPVGAGMKEEMEPAEVEGRVPCKPEPAENLVLPDPLTKDTCDACHPGGCTRPADCIDCHSEHLEGMLLPVSSPSLVFRGEFAFPDYLLRVLDSDYRMKSVPVDRIAPVPGLKKGKDLVETYELKNKGLIARMHPAGCLACHPGVLTREPPSSEEVKKSKVPRSIFTHNSPGHDRYRCSKCHLQSWLTEPDPRENIFRMEECNACHFADDCYDCHDFHQPAAKPGARVDLPYKVRRFLEATENATGEEGLP